MKVTVVMRCTRSLSDEVAGLKAPSSAASKLMSILRQYGAVALPSSATPEGIGAFVYQTFEVPDVQRANGLAAELRETDGVDSAFVKPGEELP